MVQSAQDWQGPFHREPGGRNPSGRAFAHNRSIYQGSVDPINTELVDSLKALDPERPIREADISAGRAVLLLHAMKIVSPQREARPHTWGAGASPALLTRATAHEKQPQRAQADF